MASGGARANAGRRKGTRNTKKIIKEEEERIKTHGPPPELPENHILPLDHFLRVLNDPDASDERKDRMAALAAPFCHARPTATGTNKKDERGEAAKKAAQGKFSAGAPPVRLLKAGGEK